MEIKVRQRKRRKPCSKKTTANKVKVKKSNQKKEISNKEREECRVMIKNSHVTDSRWAKVKGFNRDEVELYISQKGWIGKSQERVLKRFFYWNFIQNNNKGIPYITEDDGNRYMDYLYELGYKESSIVQHFAILTGFGTHLFHRYRRRMFRIKYHKNGMKKTFDGYISENDYFKLLDRYIDKLEWEKASILTYGYEKKIWYANFRNFTTEEFECLEWIDKANAWVNTSIEQGGLILSNIVYKCCYNWLQERRDSGVDDTELFFTCINGRGGDPGKKYYYNIYLEILSDYITMKSNSKVRKHCHSMKDFNYMYFKQLAKTKKQTEAWMRWYNKKKNKESEEI